MIQDRPYQTEAVNAFYANDFAKMRSVLIGMPTGTGKSIVIARINQRLLEMAPNARVLNLTHVKELVDNNEKTLLRVWPGAPCGVYSAGLDRRELHRPVVFGGVASVLKVLKDVGRRDLLTVDEAHLISGSEDGMYTKIIKHLRELNPQMPVLGLTATAYRQGLGLLTEGEMFDGFCYDLTSYENFNKLLAGGYLCGLHPRRTSMTLDVSGVATSKGDFNQKDLQETIDKSDLNLLAVREMLAKAGHCKSWLVFASGIEHAEHLAQLLCLNGIGAIAVHSRMGDEKRDEAIAKFKAGTVRCLVNNNVLTTGFDHPGIDFIGILRPTKSTGLWVQMLGRGTRPVYAAGHDILTDEGRIAAIAAGPKPSCLVLDFAGNSKRLGPINDPVIPGKRGPGSGGPPVKECPVDWCRTLNHPRVKFCIGCGAEFTFEVKIKAQASDLELIRTSAHQVAMFPVERVNYDVYTPVDKPSMLKVSYICGLRQFTEYICFEHSGYALHKAHEWWKRRAKTEQAPPTTKDAFQVAPMLKVPNAIRVWLDKKPYAEILDYEGV